MVYQSTKIVSIFNQLLGESAWIRKGGQQAVYHCPFCTHRKKKLEIAVDGEDFGSYNCWICGTSGKALHTLLWKLKAPPSAFTELSKYTGGPSKYTKSTDVEEVRLDLPDEFISLVDGEKTMEYVNALDYLRSRKITKEDIIRYNIGYCESGDYRNRVVMPSYDADGKLNFFCARAYNNHTNMAYMLPPWDKNIIGYELLINWAAPVTIVEGTFDAIAVRRNAIPLFGNTISDKLLLKIIESGVEEVNILLDNDALRKAMAIYTILTRYSIKTKLIKLEQKDPSVLGFNKVTEIINASSSTDYEDMVLMKINS